MKSLQSQNTNSTGLIVCADGSFVLIEDEAPKMLLKNAENKSKILSKSSVYITSCQLEESIESLYYGTPILGIATTAA